MQSNTLSPCYAGENKNGHAQLSYFFRVYYNSIHTSLEAIAQEKGPMLSAQDLLLVVI